MAAPVKYLRTAVRFAPLAAALMLACGWGDAPLGMAPCQWQLALEIPEDTVRDVESFADFRGKLFLVSRDNSLTFSLWLYDGKDLKKVELPGRGSDPRLQLGAVAASPTRAWLGGKLEDQAVLFWSDDGDEWEEAPAPTALKYNIYEIWPVSDKSAWLNAGTTTYREFAFYDNGVIAKRAIPPAGTVLAYDAKVGRFYALDRKGGGATTCWVSDDGEKWEAEDIGYELHGNYRIEKLFGNWAADGVLHQVIRCEGMSFAVLKRTGPPGQGEYALAFIKVNDPVFNELHDVAFDETGRGLAVGYRSSALYDGDRWWQEELPGDVEFELITPAAGDGFWGYSAGFFLPRELYFHP